MKWPTVILAILIVESENGKITQNSEGAVGPAQIHEDAVEDLNQHYGTEYSHKDFKSRKLSIWAVKHYTLIYGARTPQEVARIWNGGPDGMNKPETEDYWRKVKKEMEKLENESESRQHYL